MLVDNPSKENIPAIKNEINSNLEKKYGIQSKKEYIFIYSLAFKNEESLTRFKKDKKLTSLAYVFDTEMNFPFFSGIIYNNKNELIAVTDGMRSYAVHVYNEGVFVKERLILSYFLKNDPEMLFQISPTVSSVFFSLKDEELSVLITENDKLKVMSIDPFIACCWNDFFEDEFGLYKLHYE